MSRYERTGIRAMQGYSAGEQPANPDTVKLNTNENPYPPAHAVAQALATFDVAGLRRYPPATALAFRRLAAEVHGVDADNIIATNGGDELLRLAFTTFVDPGRPIGVAGPSYSLYPVLAEVHGSPIHDVPLGDDWLPADDLAARMNAAGVQLTCLVNPHAPSGTLLTADHVRAYAKALDGVLLVDEAYVDFVDPERGHDLAPLVAELPNVLLLRTLSKGYSLAGLRFGYGIGSAGLVEPMLGKTRDSYNVDGIAQTLACAALQARSDAADTWAKVRAERVRLAGALDQLGFSCLPSQANFLLAYVPGDAVASAGDLYRGLKARDVLVRWFDQPRLRDALRISIGTPAEDDVLIGHLRELLGR